MGNYLPDENLEVIGKNILHLILFLVPTVKIGDQLANSLPRLEGFR